MNSKQQAYIDSDSIEVYQTSVVVKVESINLIVGTVVGFMQLYDLRGTTNGNLVIIPANTVEDLIRIVSEVLCPEGFEEKEDYFLLWSTPMPTDRELDSLMEYVYADFDSHNRISWIECHQFAEKAYVIRYIPNSQLQWVRNFIADPIWSKIRFKRTLSGYPQFVFPSGRIDVVDEQTFQRQERTRLPLYVGTQFGIYPPIEGLVDRHIAVLQRSLLSGSVAGLSIVRMSADGARKQVVVFDNK